MPFGAFSRRPVGCGRDFVEERNDDYRYGMGVGDLSLLVPDGVSVETVGRQPAENPNELSVLQRALAAPLGAPLLSDVLTGAKSALVVVK